ncbi:hypothetical protein F9817_21450 [Vibrio sp. CAIM 722]|uniref:Uncharacterized protein n=1 Tax=Vibrio eleionomae TaxID=2653505 RepID=A0A7X4RWJ5_9VIBR|nr:hypothetical protein [Vibrio eleionomae]MZI95753.1 hypothetical protein [Vibrio eleionomae]
MSVNLANHPHKNSLFEKKQLNKENHKVNYFIDSKGFFEFLNKQEKIGMEKLAALQKNASKFIQPAAKAAAD